LAEKLDVIDQLKKGDRSINICCNIRFARINLRVFRDNGDRITEGAKSGTIALVCVA